MEEKHCDFLSRRYSLHSIERLRSLINRAGVASLREQFGIDLERVSIEMTFSLLLGVNPKVEAEKVRELCRTGVADFLIIGNEVVGTDRWTISEVREKVSSWDNAGNILLSTLEVTFESYK